MIHQDVMISYSRRDRTYRFYADGRQQTLKGEAALDAVILMLKSAVEKGGSNRGYQAENYIGR